MLLAAGVDPTDVITWGLVLMAAVGALGAVVWYLRRQYVVNAPSASSEVWSLQQLRDLHAGGQISEAEFQRLRAEMIGAHGLQDRGRNDASDREDSAYRMDADDGWIDVKGAADEGR